MSRGMGRIERAILAAFVANPDAAFSTDELCIMIYGAVEKRHRVAVVRAGMRLCESSWNDATLPGICTSLSPGWRPQNQPYIWVNRYSLISKLTGAHPKWTAEKVAKEARDLPEDDTRALWHRMDLAEQARDVDAYLAELGEANLRRHAYQLRPLSAPDWCGDVAEPYYG